MQDYNEWELIETLRELNFDYTEKGIHIELFKCPFCENDRPKKSDHFSFRRDTGQFNCVKCSEAGNLITFRRKMGVDPFTETIIKTPDQAKVKKISDQPKSYYEMYSNARGISVATLEKYKVGKYLDKKLGMCRTYQYVDQNSLVVNVKYVNKFKQMKTEYRAKKCFYGVQFLDFGKDYLHVCEGEDDVHALVDMGFDNVVSVPYGAGSYSPEMGKINARFKKIYLLFDNDLRGQEGAEKFARKAGVWKCYNVLLPFKDSRECLLNSIDKFGIEKCKENAVKFEYSLDDKTRPALDSKERFDRYVNELKKGGGIKFGYSVVDGITGGLRSGEVLSIVANPECYKTTLAMNLIIRASQLIESGFVLFFSLEMAVESVFEREVGILQNTTRSEIKTKVDDGYSKQNIENIVVNGLSRVMVSDESYINLDEMIKIIKQTEEVREEKCLLVAVDYSDFVTGKGRTEYELIKEVSNGFKSRVCRGLGLAGIMLYQTSRENNKKKTDEVTARSGKGSTAIEAGSDFMLGLWMNKDDEVIGRVMKHRRVSDQWKNERWPYFGLNIPVKKTMYISDIYLANKESDGFDD